MPATSPPSTPDSVLLLPGAWPSSQRGSVAQGSPLHAQNLDNLDLVLDFQQRLVNRMETPSTPIVPADSLDSDITRIRTDTSSLMLADTSAVTVCSFSSDSEPPKILPRLPSKPTRSSLESEFRTRIPRHIKLHRRTSEQLHFRPAALDSPCIAGTPSPPVSPMIFSSPTSSAFPRRRPQTVQQPSPLRRSSSFECGSSPSWDTSYNSDMFNSSSPSPSPSPPARPRSVALRLSVATQTLIDTDVPMITSLSLPASPDITLDSVPPTSPQLSPVEDDASPWTLSLSSASPALPAVPELSLSEQQPHVVSFPSPTESSPLETPLTLSTIPNIDSDIDLGAAYASAVVSSAWTPDGPALSTLLPVAMDPPLSAPIQLEERSSAHIIGPTRLSVIQKLKRFGQKLKTMLRTTPRDRVTASHQVFPDVIDIRSPASQLPPPPGLGLRRPKSRPLLSPRTHNSNLTLNGNSSSGSRVLRRPKSSGTSHAIRNPAKSQSSDKLAAQARPREIKSKRRLSLPVISNFTSPRPQVNVVTSSRRVRPVSALAFQPRPPALGTFRSETLLRPSTSGSAVGARAETNMAPMRPGSDRLKKKHRRFSLSALSSFAVGGRGNGNRNGSSR